MREDYPDDTEAGYRGPVIYRNGNGANKAVWWVAATVVSLLLLAQAYMDSVVIDTHTEVARLNQLITDKLK